MAKRKPTAPVRYYARIPAQNPRGNPAHLAGNISIFGFRLTAGGPWAGPFNAAKAETLREHAVNAKAAMTFEVVDGKTIEGQPGGPPAPEKPARKGKAAAAESEDEGPENPQAGEGAAFGRTRRARPSAEKAAAKRKPAKRKPAKKSGAKRSGK